MNKEQGFNRLVNVVKNELRHSNYQKNVDNAELYHVLFTGENVEMLLKKYARREDDALFKQRCEISQHVFTCAVKSIMDVFYKVPRALSNRVLASSSEEKNGNIAELEDILKKYYGNASLDDWMATRWLELNGIDPNCFIVEEFAAFDNKKERAQPYPFEVSSSMAIDYKYTNNVLDYLICKQTADKMDRFTMYLANETIVFQQVEVNNLLTEQNEGVIYQLGEDFAINLNKKTYIIETPIPHNAGKVPAAQVGVFRAKVKSGVQDVPFVSFIHEAIPFLKKSIKVNSELDLVMSNMAFPIKISYVYTCDECEGHKQVDGHTCGSCNGTGKKNQTSAMETLEIGMNGSNVNAENMLDLSKMVAFVAPPTDIIKVMEEYVDKVTSKAKEIVFNSDVFTRSEVAQTATEKTLDSQNVYDALQPVFKAYSHTWMHKVGLIASFTDLDKGLIYNYSFNKDAKLKSKSELYNDLVLINAAGAPNEVRRDVYNDLARITYSDNPTEYMKFQVKERFNPFAGFSQEAITMALLSEFVDKRTKVLYFNFGTIFDTLEAEVLPQDFYELDPRKQKVLIDEKVNVLMSELQPVAPQIGN